MINNLGKSFPFKEINPYKLSCVVYLLKFGSLILAHLAQFKNNFNGSIEPILFYFLIYHFYQKSKSVKMCQLFYTILNL